MAGENAGAFLNIGVGARAMALGGAFSSSVDDGTAFYWNPAGLSLISKRELNMMYTSLFGFPNSLASYQSISYVQPLQQGAAISLGWIRLSSNDIPRFPELVGGDKNPGPRTKDKLLQGDGNPQGHFSDAEDALFFSFGKMSRYKLDLGWQYFVLPLEFPLGGSLKYIHYSLAGKTARGVGFDIGGGVRFAASDLFAKEYLGKVALALVFQNVANTAITWETRRQDVVPYKTKISISYLQPLTFWRSKVTLSWEKESKKHKKSQFGVEYTYKNGLSFRGGYNGESFSMGTGMIFRALRVDYALSSHELGSIHRINAAVRF